MSVEELTTVHSEQWTFVRELGLHDDLITALPSTLSRFTRLEHLDLSGCMSLENIDSLFCYFPRLRSLRLSLTLVTSWPLICAQGYEQLEVLDISKTNLTELPPNLNNLRVLNMNNIEIQNIRENRFPELKYIAIQHLEKGDLCNQLRMIARMRGLNVYTLNHALPSLIGTMGLGVNLVSYDDIPKVLP